MSFQLNPTIGSLNLMNLLFETFLNCQQLISFNNLRYSSANGANTNTIITSFLIHAHKNVEQKMSDINLENSGFHLFGTKYHP